MQGKQIGWVQSGQKSNYLQHAKAIEFAGSLCCGNQMQKSA
jgi:hypothetical protein